MFRVLIQARMSSSRFPGKVLAPFLGKPLIGSLLDRVAHAVPKERIMVVTSREKSDDPLAAYVEQCLGAAVFRGELDDVFARFQGCLKAFPCDWFVRISGDSPAIDGELIAHMLKLAGDGSDIVTNVASRTFPPGQSVEILRSVPFLNIDGRSLDAEDKAHVTLPYYRAAAPFRMIKVVSRDPSLAKRRMVVDSIEDLRAMEALLQSSPDQATGYARLAEIQA